MYAFFAAEGRVMSVEEKTSKKGTTFTVLLLDVSDGKYGHELEVTAFHGAAEYAGDQAGHADIRPRGLSRFR